MERTDTWSARISVNGCGDDDTEAYHVYSTKCLKALQSTGHHAEMSSLVALFKPGYLYKKKYKKKIQKKKIQK